MKETEKLIAELSTFRGREQDLRHITRWSDWGPMFYRPNVYVHSKHVGWFVEHVAPVLTKILGDSFDVKRSIATALVHDDPEIETGDYQAGSKAKMTPEQLAAIDAEERVAIKTLVERYPKTVGGYSYEELQNDIQDLRTPEAQVAKFLDLIDGYGEGIHELYAGNKVLVNEIVNEFGEIPAFDNLNFTRRRKMMEKYPILAKLKDSHIFFELIPPIEWEPILKTGKPHTFESLQHPYGYVQYDEWKKVIFGSGDSEEMKNLYTQTEFT